MAFQTTNLNNCFICGKPVIDFEYHSAHFEPYELNNTDEAYKAGAFGTCHAYCLSNSSWGSYWFEKKKQLLLEQFDYPELGKMQEGGVMLRGDNEELYCSIPMVY